LVAFIVIFKNVSINRLYNSPLTIALVDLLVFFVAGLHLD